VRTYIILVSRLRASLPSTISSLSRIGPKDPIIAVDHFLPPLTPGAASYRGVRRIRIIYLLVSFRTFVHLLFSFFSRRYCEFNMMASRRSLHVQPDYGYGNSIPNEVVDSSRRYELVEILVIAAELTIKKFQLHRSQSRWIR
jgi:hypothetical protein